MIDLKFDGKLIKHGKLNLPKAATVMAYLMRQFCSHFRHFHALEISLLVSFDNDIKSNGCILRHDGSVLKQSLMPLI
jgi:hypothetical protein